MALPTVHVLFENPAWLPPLVSALEAEGFPVRPVEVWRGLIDPARPPEPGIYWNRMSPSSHTRGHDDSVALMREMLAWLEGCGRRVINGARSFEIEVSKLRQDLALRRHGLLTPRTVLAVGRDETLAAAAAFDGRPFLTKHNQGGKGLGIHLFSGVDDLRRYLDDSAFDAGPNRQLVLQEYIVPAEPFITRVELCAGRFLYAMRSSTAGGFELCPSDVCEAERRVADVCPADGSATFTPSPLTANDPLVAGYAALMEAEGFDIAGIEFVEDAAGHRYTYDINANTNYNSAVGQAFGIDGMREVARWLRQDVAPGLQ